MISDEFENFTPGMESPAVNGEAIIPNDEADLPFATRGIWIGTGGDLTVTLTGGTTVTYPDIPSGVVFPIRAKRVFETGTTASGLASMR